MNYQNTIYFGLGGTVIGAILGGYLGRQSFSDPEHKDPKTRIDGIIT